MSALFDYITGKKSGREVELDASLEHMGGHLGVEMDDNEKLRAEVERLTAERNDARRTIWCLVHGVGAKGKAMLFRSDLESYPGPDRAWLETTTDEATGNVTFRAFEQSLRDFK